jgi:hypothetical protein
MKKSILEFFPKGYTPSDIQAKVLKEIEVRWANTEVFILNLEVASGKCLKVGTKIRMFDGSAKAVEDILSGEYVMGPDSLPRKVLNTCSGSAQLYTITPKRGPSYTVTHNHILCLKTPKHIYDKGYKKTIQVKQHITVSDFLNKSKSFQKNAKQYSEGVSYPAKQLKIDPYILGLWLGDGHSMATTLTTMDNELASEWITYGESRGLDYRTSVHKGKATTYHFKCKGVSTAKNRNLFKKDIGSYGLFSNKHIPFDYLTSSRKQRLELLAGLIDTDGHVNAKTRSITFSLVNERLLNDIITLARSLGFSATRSKNKVVDEVEYPRCSISGQHVEDIPVRLLRKKPKNSKSDQRNCSIEVEDAGIGRYAGIEVSGDHEYLLDTFVVTHNSFIAHTIAEYAKAKSRARSGARICTPTTTLVDQYAADFKDTPVAKSAGHYKCEVRATTCGAYKSKDRCRGCVYNQAVETARHSPISISTYHMNLVLKYKRSVTIFDEAHRVADATRDMAKTGIFAHRVQMPEELIGADITQIAEWAKHIDLDLLSNSERNFLLALIADADNDAKLHCYNWSAASWSNGGLAWDTKLKRSEPITLPTLNAQPLDIFSRPPVFWQPGQKLVLMSATIGRPDLYELGLDRTRPIFITGDSPIPAKNQPIIKDYIGSINHQNKEQMLQPLADKILCYLNTMKGKGVIHITYGLAKLLKPMLNHDRLITHGPSDMKAGLKKFLASEDKVFLVSGMYEGVSLDYAKADWQVISKISWPSLTDPLQQHRAKDDQDYYLWSTLKTVIQTAGRVCRRPDDYGATYILDSSFDRLLDKAEHLVPANFSKRIVKTDPKDL